MSEQNMWAESGEQDRYNAAYIKGRRDMAAEYARSAESGECEDGPDDGSYSEAVPLGWQGHGIDWEIYRPGDRECADLGVRWMGRGYDEEVLVAEVYARGPRRLNRKMRAAEKDHGLRRNGVL